MKVNKILKTILIVLVIVLVSILSFAGIYVQDKNKMENKVKEYQLGMDLEGYRKIELDVSTGTTTKKYDADGKEIESTDTTTEAATTEEVKKNEEEVLTIDNYKSCRSIIEKRLKVMGVNDYEMRLDETTGKIVLHIPENDNTDTIVAQLQYQGDFEVIDADTKEVLMTNADLKSVKAGYGSTSSGTTSIFVNFQFNKEGTEKFKNITNTYQSTTSTDEETGEETTTEKKITINLDGSTLISTTFDKEVTNGLLQLSVGSSSSSTTSEDLQSYLKTASNLSALLDSGKMPVVYEIAQNKYVASEVTRNNIELFISLCIIAATVAMVYLIVKFKEKGILSSISLIGYVASLLLVLRYTNVVITIDGVIAIVISTVLAYLAMYKMIECSLKTDSVKGITKYLLALIPVIIIAIVFTFNSWLPVFSFGMVMFWGIIINIVYNFIITRTLLIDSKN